MSKIICYCENVSEKTILEAIANGAKTLKDIQKSTGACTGNTCAEKNPSGKCCSRDINKLLKGPIHIQNNECSCCKTK